MRNYIYDPKDNGTIDKKPQELLLNKIINITFVVILFCGFVLYLYSTYNSAIIEGQSMSVVSILFTLSTFLTSEEPALL